jgi:broad specificity phosphatase PhoE
MIYIIRHGQTRLNKANVLQGRRDTPLNEKGRQQASQAAEWFRSRGIHFDYVFSSPLKRAMDTAKICCDYIEPVKDERLIEMDYGPYEGADLGNPAPEIVEFFSDFVNNPAPAGMEQLADVVGRTGEFLEEIKNLEGNILISTHAIAMKGILEYLMPDSCGSWWSKYIGNCDVYRTEVAGDHFVCPEILWCQGQKLPPIAPLQVSSRNTAKHEESAG